jgi:HAE1 family hydrophobic/amphiphilic exporter-1
VKIAKLEGEYKSADFRNSQDSTVILLEAADAVVARFTYCSAFSGFCDVVFLHSIRNSLIVMVSIPASLIATLLGFI